MLPQSFVVVYTLQFLTTVELNFHNFTSSWFQN